MPLTSYANKAYKFENIQSLNKFYSIYSETIDIIKNNLIAKIYELGTPKIYKNLHIIKKFICKTLF